MRDSSLSASIQAIVAAEVGHLDLAYDYLRETALVDLHDLAGNTADGLHLAALGGRLAGRRRRVRRHARPRRRAGVRAAPARGADRLAFRLRYRGRRLRVEIGPREATYELLEGEELPVHHHGDWLQLQLGAP